MYSIYISLTHTFTIITDCHRSLFIEIYHRYYSFTHIYFIYNVSHRMCTGTLQKSRINARRHRVLHVYFSRTHHARIHALRGVRVPRGERARTRVAVVVLSLIMHRILKCKHPAFTIDSRSQRDSALYTRARSIHVGCHACGRVRLWICIYVETLMLTLLRERAPCTAAAIHIRINIVIDDAISCRRAPALKAPLKSTPTVDCRAT